MTPPALKYLDNAQTEEELQALIGEAHLDRCEVSFQTTTLKRH